MCESNLAQCSWTLDRTCRFLLLLIGVEVSAAINPIIIQTIFCVAIATDGILLREVTKLLQRLAETGAVEHATRREVYPRSCELVVPAVDGEHLAKSLVVIGLAPRLLDGADVL